MLNFQQVSKNYAEVRAVDTVTFELRTGEVFGLVGPNGSGKSTLLKLMLGIIKPSAGQLLVNGQTLSEKGWQDFRKTIGFMPERISFYDNLTGAETLRLFARIKGGSVDSITDILDKLLSKDALNRRVGGYSKGMRQRLNLAQALVNTPSLLVLDEPTSGLDPIGTRQLYEIIDSVRRVRPLTVVLSSHILAEIEDKVTRVGVMKSGELKACGTLDELYEGFNLPLKLYIALKDRNSLLEEILNRDGAVNIAYRDNHLMADLPREHKFRVLSSILEQKNLFVDFSVREPNLEEVFFGIH
ncbi:ABC transporter ATP-binding protein [Candidatus Magnetobacterium casense]|uniref:ABC transporter ATP-binding protein n=1 Tax=Candidatus Magnetobacterium casense TaxID=1455061 RepID=A0ABS6RVK2_9BACT|nr:ABC transporter ATP-binding protein [Candidatus Magnetobacterium casensis]MBV6340044.1 ABC transporter ATP-binding protein [Candidatus Magnetobacterium casensis]